MSNRILLITGCQRSGTTLLNLILDSHDAVRAVDESEFDPEKLDVYLTAVKFGPNVAFKLPRYAHKLDFIRGLPDVTVLWCVRDPRDTVASMVSLHLPVNSTVSVAWASHPYGADMEIGNAFKALEPETQKRLYGVYKQCQQAFSKQPVLRSREDAVRGAAFCWRVKNELITNHKREDTNLRLVCYEDLVEKPRQVIGDLLDSLGLAWDENVLRHHELHSGLSVGGTVKNRPIDPGNPGKWQRLLNEADLAIVREIDSELAGTLGYEI
ncbi:MAG: sulfotransferase [Gammaproteobacteria bacterium]